MAALNNADLYRGVCEAHGIAVIQTQDELSVVGTPPRYFSNVVTLSPSRTPVVAGGSWGMKDSFACCQPEGCDLLFEAMWIHRLPFASVPTLEWQVVRTPRQLAVWLDAWGQGDSEVGLFPPQFPESMLLNDEFRFVSGFLGGELAAGCLLNRSPGAVGLSNTFVNRPGLNLFPDFACTANQWMPGTAVVGYERDANLESAIIAGFEPIGKLRVWVK